MPAKKSRSKKPARKKSDCSRVKGKSIKVKSSVRAGSVIRDGAGRYYLVAYDSAGAKRGFRTTSSCAPKPGSQNLVAKVESLATEVRKLQKEVKK